MAHLAPPIEPLLDSEWRQFRPTLTRTIEALTSLGMPHLRFPHILVGGTNGKGTVCWNVARNLPSPVGLFMSPHLVDVRERILIDGKQVPDTSWHDAYDRIRCTLPSASLSYFEWLILIAVDVFLQHKIRWAVFEVGLGGRLDATNALEPCLSVVTNVGLDHMEFLGNSRDQIALEKIEIARKNRPLIIPDNVLNLPDVTKRLNALGPHIQRIFLPDPPKFSNNGLIVDAILQRLNMPRRAHGMSCLPGRRSRLDIGAGVFLDGAHNVMAWEDTARWVCDVLPSGVRMICGLTEGRNPEEFLSILKPVVSEVFVWPAGFVREISRSAWPPEIEVIETQAIPNLFDRPLLVCGSLYLLGRFLEEFNAGIVPQPSRWQGLS